MHPAYDSSAYLRIVSDAASAKGGATDACKVNFRRVQPLVSRLAASLKGRRQLSASMRTCKNLDNEAEAQGLVAWLQEPWSYLAMGNFPYASSYLVHGAGLLPAYPVRAACQSLDLLPPDATVDELLEAAREAAGVYYNFSKTVSCFYNNATTRRPPIYGAPRAAAPTPARPHARAQSGGESECVGDWGYSWCTEMVQPFSNDGVRDMFWPPAAFNLTSASDECYAEWRVRPRPQWPVTQFGDKAHSLYESSNIVFSNGLLDPWSAGGVLHTISQSVVAIVIPSGAHHSDFMFENELDGQDVKAARATERQHIARWIALSRDQEKEKTETSRKL